MRSVLVSFSVGLVFGVGLLLAGMTQPKKVVAFLDPLNGWDPSLGLVMVGAIAVHFLAYRLVPRLSSPLFDRRGWSLPTRRDVDARLVAGAALFGAGWALGGYCPGPALAAFTSGAGATLTFTGSMLVGMWGFSLWEASRAVR
ncbi:MAG: DUF6691 family protein [Myxococcota bacterium]